MTPYYDHAGITIYHGDCGDILPHLPPVDLVLTDPPYGIAYNPGGRGRGWTRGVKTFSEKDLIHDDNKPFNPEHLLALEVDLILWGANHFADKLPAKPSWLVWDKRQEGLSNDFADCEMAWCSMGFPARMFRHLWYGAFRKSERGERRLHPTQKPLALMKWCLSFVENGETVLDPYAGSGTTLVAAKELGRKAIGIEIEEKYCEIAAKRLSQEVFEFQPKLAGNS